MTRGECTNCGYTTDVQPHESLRAPSGEAFEAAPELCAVCWHTFASRYLTYPGSYGPIFPTIAWCTNRILDEIRAQNGHERHDPRAAQP